MSFRRMLPFILINIVVSATVMLAILFWWENQRTPAADLVAESPATPVRPVTTAVADLTLPPVDESEPPGEPESDALVHTVVTGDTLGNISAFYDVPLDDIMVANGLTDPNLLAVGQQLVIPVGGLPTPTPPPPTATPAPDIIPTPIPTAVEDSVGEVVIEITAVNNPGTLSSESVEIKNLGGRQVALQGWQLVDSQRHIYTFGQVTLYGDGAAILIHTTAGQNGTADLYWGQSEAVWQSGELVTLLNADGEIVNTTVVP